MKEGGTKTPQCMEEACRNSGLIAHSPEDTKVRRLADRCRQAE